jgi:microcystin-dependent protein
MPGYAVPNPRFRAFDANGDPLAGGLLETYAAGTSTPLAVYTDQALSVAHSNPVVLDANGEATIYIAAGLAYKFVLKNSSGAQQYSIDPYEIAEPETPDAADPVPTGAILPYGGASAPTGFLMCDGSAVSRSTYADLFTVLNAAGLPFGAGDGSTTFNVPDCRQRFPLGKAASGTGSSLGQTGGTVDHVHTGPSHTHDVTVPRDGWGGEVNANGVAGRLYSDTGSGVNVMQATLTPTATSAAGGTGNTGTANPPYIALNYIIKT